jgi:nucleotide-binding universal stress UspA family protein
MAPYTKALLALPLTDAASGLIEYTAFLSRLGIVHEIEVVHVVTEGTAELGRVESEMKSAVGDQLPSSRVSFHALEGDRTDKILQFSAERQTELVLLGHRRSRNPRRSLLRRLAMKAPCSVWLVPDGSEVALSRVIAPVDLSEHSADSLREAISIASIAGLREVTALHVYFEAEVVSYSGSEARAHRNDQNEISRFLSGIDDKRVQVVPESIEAPNVAHAIHHLSTETSANLIVMSTRGRSRAASVLLGSETEQALRETNIPIIAVKHFGASRNLLQVLFNRKTWRHEEPRFG